MNYWLKIKTIFFIIFFFLFIFFNPKLTLAQSSAEGQGWFCAKTTECEGPDYQEGTCTQKNVHRVRLEVDPDPKNKPRPNIDETYLVECLSAPNNGEPDFRCTTGDSNLDIRAFGVDSYSWLKDHWNYSLEKDNNYGIFKVDNNQAVKIGAKQYKTGPSSNLIIKDSNEPVSVFEWQSYGYYEYNYTATETRGGALDHKFYFYQKIQPQPTIELGQGGEQLATSPFEFVNADQDCVVITWDPAGRVFDALSLEPIPNASVYLTKDDGKGNFVRASELGIINPQLTNSQGGFSFYVSDGDYKLSINNLGSLGYERIASNLSEVNSKYDQIYYHLISEKKRTFIYPVQTGEIIQQRGKMEYRDIPLIPKGGVGKTYPLKVLSAFYSVNKLSGKATIEGSVSHPFTQIVIYGINNATVEAGLTDANREKIYQGITDNLGNYKVVFTQGENGKTYNSFVVDFQKTDLTTIAKKNSLLAKIISWLPIKKIVSAQTKATDKVSLRLNPIPTYLEGVARDPSGKVLANSQVKIYIKGMNIPYTVVNTDDQGYFKISSSSLPSFPYEIKYQNSLGKVVTVSTSKFIADNRNLISSKKINLYSLKDDQGRSILSPTPKTTKSPSVAVSTSEKWDKSSGLGSQEKPLPTKKTQVASSSLNSGIILILAIILFLVILVGVIVYFYFRQKKSSSTLV